MLDCAVGDRDVEWKAEVDEDRASVEEIVVEVVAIGVEEDC